MTSAQAKPATPAPGRLGTPARNPTATVALVVAIVGFVVTEVPDFIGFFAGGPEDLVALILGIIAIVTASRRGIGKAKAIAATVIAGAALLGIPLGEGIFW
jgi:hypothetical protein